MDLLWKIFILFLTTFCHGIKDTDFLLSGNHIPLEYKLTMGFGKSLVFNRTNSFQGSVQIIIDTIEPTNYIDINAGVGIHIHSVSVNHTKPEYYEPNPNTEILKIHFKEKFLGRSILTLRFGGNVKNAKGLSHTFAEDDDCLVTKFGTNKARHVFPCFDEPKYIAKYQYFLENSFEDVFVSNTNVTVVAHDLEDFNIDSAFTPPIPTYQVAFAVTSLYVTDFLLSSGYFIKIFVRPEYAHYARFTVESAHLIMDRIKTISHLELPENYRKIDLVAVPNYHGESRCFVGICIFSETKILWDVKRFSHEQKQTMLTTLTRELFHSIVGLRDPIKDWSMAFFHEGISRSYAVYIMPHIYSEYEVEAQFIVDVHLKALELESSYKAQPLYRSIRPIHIPHVYNMLQYDKIASIFRMMSYVIGPNTFYETYFKYLNDSTSIYSDIKTFNKMFDSTFSCRCQENFKVQHIMDSWISQPGYPVVTVKMKEKKNDSVILYQERFVLDAEEDFNKEKNEKLFYIPISYTLSDELFSNRFSFWGAQVWLTPKSNLTISLRKYNRVSRYLLLNNHVTGLFRVNYDVPMWKAIAEDLKKDYTSIDLMTRVQIVDDVINLARADYMSYALAMPILDYLANETSIWPWIPALKGFEFLLKRTYGCVYRCLERRVLRMLENMSNIQPNNLNKNNMDYIESLKTKLIHEWNCLLGRCIYYLELYKFSENELEETFPSEIRQFVYCDAVRRDDSVWRFLRLKYYKTRDDNEKDYIINGMACTYNREYMESYVKSAFDLGMDSLIPIEDRLKILIAVLKWHEHGAKVILKVMKSNLPKIYYNPYTNFDTLIDHLGDYLFSSEHHSMVSQLSNIQMDDGGKDLFPLKRSLLEIVAVNKAWGERKKAELETVLRENNECEEDCAEEYYRKKALSTPTPACSVCHPCAPSVIETQDDIDACAMWRFKENLKLRKPRSKDIFPAIIKKKLLGIAKEMPVDINKEILVGINEDMSMVASTGSKIKPLYLWLVVASGLNILAPFPVILIELIYNTSYVIYYLLSLLKYKLVFIALVSLLRLQSYRILLFVTFITFCCEFYLI